MYYFLKKFLYRFQYGKYIKQLPFYMVREFTVKENYAPDEVNYAIETHGFNKRFSPIAYAMFCTAEQYEKASMAFLPCPSYAQIRTKIAALYFNNNVTFDLYQLMQNSTFKTIWGSNRSSSSRDAVQEYWRYMAELKKIEETEEREGDTL